MWLEVVEVVVEQTECEVVGDVAGRPRLRVGLVPAHHETADFFLEIGAPVGIAQCRRIAREARNPLGHDELMFHRLQRDADPRSAPI